MKVLVIGGGAREHALVWKLTRSPRVDTVYVLPGNAGTESLAQQVDLGMEDRAGLLRFARSEGIDLTVVGPEVPLVEGIVDLFEEAGLSIFGPTQSAARLEGSKVFCKELMCRHGIPTGAFRVFRSPQEAEEYLEEWEDPVVIKADGLAAGKGVSVCHSYEQACDAINTIMKERIFGSAGDQVLVEECLVGQEVSVLAFTDGRTLCILETCQDHKAALDGGEGPNTGGMGAYSPAPFVTSTLQTRIEREILVPLLHALNVEEIPYRGFLYAGLMLTEDGPKVLEFNVRLGDPEAQALLVRMRTDLVDLMEATLNDKLHEVSIEWDPRPSVCLVLTSQGYPGAHATGHSITGIESAEAAEDVVVFHGGTARRRKRPITAGGRVLSVTALGEDLQSARSKAYEAASRIHFEGKTYRSDIAASGLTN